MKIFKSREKRCSTAQHSTAQHSTAQHSTAQHSTAQHSTAQHSTAIKVYHKFLLITSLIFGLAVFNACPENSPKSGNSNPASQGPSTYTITYNANKADSGTAPIKQEKQPGQGLTLAANSGILKRTGYVFKGWNTKADGTGTSYTAGAGYTEDKAITLYAEWWSLISYNANGSDSGTIPTTQEKKAGKDSIIASNAGNLVKQGEYFAGWNTKADGTGDHYNAGSKYTLDKALTLYVEWASVITLSYDTNGADSGTAPIKQEKQPGQDLTIADNSGTLARTDYVFKGWNTQADGKGTSYTAGAGYTEDKAITLYAEWWALISYDANGADSGTAPIKQEKQAGQDLTLAANSGILKRTSYVFKGWNTKADGTGTSYTAGAGYTEDKAITLYAEWWALISYDANGADSGTAPIKQEKQAGQDLTLAANSGTLKRTGYVFYGWNTQADQRGTHYELGAQYSEVVSQTLYAEWGIPISTAADLEQIRKTLNEAYVLQQDIDLSSIANFEPIGKDSQTAFTGIFKGRGHTISKLTITRETEERVGFFGYLKGWVYNVHFKQANVKGKGGSGDPGNTNGGVGVLAGRSGGSTIQRVTVQDSEVAATNNNAGLLIGITSGTIEDCGVEGTVTAARFGAGGLVGQVNNGTTFRRSYAKGEVTGNLGAGGLLGIVTSPIVIEDCYADVRVKGSYRIGGLIGGRYGILRNTYAVGKVTNTGTPTAEIGGLVGEMATSSSIITHSYFDSSSTGQSKGVGLVDRTVTGTPTAYTTSDLTGSDKFPDWDFTGINGKPAIWHWLGTGKWPILQWQYEMQQAP